MSCALPFHLPEAYQSPIDVTSVLTVCPVSERPVWEALSELLHNAGRMEAFEIHLEPSGESLRVRYRSVFDFAETRLPLNDIALKAVNILASRLWGSDRNDVARRGWFKFTVSEKPLLFQLDNVPCSIGSSFLITALEDVSQQPARLEDIGLSREQLSTLKCVLESRTGLLVVASRLPQVHRRTSRAIAQSLISPDVKVVMADTPLHPLIPGTSQLGLDIPATTEQRKNWQALCQMGADAIIAAQTLENDMSVQLINLAAEKALVVISVDEDNASSCLARLMGLGARSETLAHKLNGLILQHRIRCLCTYCRVGSVPDDLETAWLARYSPVLEGNINNWVRHRMRCSFSEAPGCDHCNGTGHRTWLDVFDLVTVTPDVKNALFDADYQSAMIRIDGEKSLAKKLLKLAQEGIISLSEACRVTDEL
ncbi:MAG: ATPase, T2SS/T4P/T4SS family [Granulosicoccus sp.]